MAERLYRIVGSHFVAGIVADGNKPVRWAPIFNRAVREGYHLKAILMSYRNRGCTIEDLGELT
jgi:hypothetical protein